jgi:hypothetical protein
MESTRSSKSLLNANKVNKKDSLSKEMIERDEIKDSPFTVITMEGQSFGVMGDYRLTEKSDTKEEVIEKLEKITWNRIIQVMMILKEVDEKNKVKKK